METVNQFYERISYGRSWYEMRKKILKRNKYVCCNCKKKFPIKELEIHHKINRMKGGNKKKDNLIVLCKSCHKECHYRITLK
jgi:5-methylcytosine-specific restriction enzyme A